MIKNKKYDSLLVSIWRHYNPLGAPTVESYLS